jgi:hypothetical protein
VGFVPRNSKSCAYRRRIRSCEIQVPDHLDVAGPLGLHDDHRSPRSRVDEEGILWDLDRERRADDGAITVGDEHRVPRAKVVLRGGSARDEP